MNISLEEQQKKLNSLTIELFQEYKKSPTFQASIYSANQRYFFNQLNDANIDIEEACEKSPIDCINLYPKKSDAFDIYPSQYIEHRIKENKLEIKLKNKTINFNLK